MNYLSLALIVFYDDKLNVVVQQRKNNSEVGEKYAFWGGKIKEDETPFQAIKREMYDDFGYVPEKMEYWGQFKYFHKDEGIYQNYEIRQYVFLAPISDKRIKARITKKESMVLLKLDDAIRGDGFSTGSTNFLKALKQRVK